MFGMEASEGCARCYEDAFNLICGERLGAGIHRSVFVYRINPEWVVKVEAGETRHFANVMENKFWEDHQHCKKVSEWLAECRDLSPDGRILLQRRVDPLPVDFKFPAKMPEFLTDLKRSNFGLLKGRLVCVDYALTLPNPSLDLKRARWRRDE